MNTVLRRAAKMFAAGVSAAEAFRIALAEEPAQALQTILDLKWEASFDARVDEDLRLDWEAFFDEDLEPTSQYVDSRDSAEAPAIQ